MGNLSADEQTALCQQLKDRKRKQPDCECSSDLKEMRSEMSRISSLLEKYVGSNEQIMQKMQDNIDDIKTQINDMKTSNEQTINIMQKNVDTMITEINDIKSSTSNMSSEQKIIQSQITQIEKSMSQGENKIKTIESELKILKQSSQTTSSKLENQLCLGEQIIQEIQNRNYREKNIMLVGIPEPTSSKAGERVVKDETNVLNVISAVSSDIVNHQKYFVLGSQIRARTAVSRYASTQ